MAEITKTCPVCHKEFVPRLPNQRFCSPTCRVAHKTSERLRKWVEGGKKRKRQSLNSRMFHDLDDHPSDGFLKWSRGVRG
jgi:hypothetical protein